jgi:23S rRNA (uracil1939-C5)-methyltransferase
MSWWRRLLARLLNDLLDSCFMVKGRCPYFGRCGGCTAQHVDYADQLENKKKQLVQAIDFEDVKAFSGTEYAYRNRMDFVFHKTGVGLRQRGKWDRIVDVETCAIANAELNVLLKEVRDFFTDVDAFDVRKHSGTFKYAVIRTPQNDSSISFVLNEDSSRITEATEKIEEFAKKSSVNNVVVTYVSSKTDVSVSGEFYVVKGKDMLHENYLGKEFVYSVQGFFQNNHKMAENMKKYVYDLLAKYDTSNVHLLDLYGGVGSFGVLNADLFNGVTVVESVKECIDAAEINLKENNITNGSAVVMDAKNLRKLDVPSPLFVITDPPRCGMHLKTIAQLNELNPKVIIYVSCNVAQLAKELDKFFKHKVESAAMFDLFPQTPHSEAVVELVLDEKD